jgi:hypothetical protein
VTDRETMMRINEESRDRLSERERRIVGLSAFCIALGLAWILNVLLEAK